MWTMFEEGKSRRSYLLIGKEKVTEDRLPTDRPTSAQQYDLSSSKGGIKKDCFIGYHREWTIS